MLKIRLRYNNSNPTRTTTFEYTSKEKYRKDKRRKRNAKLQNLNSDKKHESRIRTKTELYKNKIKMNNEKLLENLRCIPDFPQKGINFRDVTTLFKNAECLKIMVDELYEIYKDKGITKIVGIESRGFVLSSALAIRLGAGVVLCRKPGKLPAETVQESYTKEYGEDTIEIHKDAIDENDVVLLHDDLLATGGTMRAAYNLVKKFNPKGIYMNFIIELVNEGLNGRESFEKGTEITSLLKV